MKNRKGETYVLVCVIVLIISMLFSVIVTYASAITLIRVQKENAEIVFDSFVSNNSIVIYNNIKRGKNAMHGIDTASYRTMLTEFCTLDYSDGMLYSIDANGEDKYSLTVPEIEYIENEKLELTLSYTMFVPIKFAGVKVVTAVVPITITSQLTKKS